MKLLWRIFCWPGKITNIDSVFKIVFEHILFCRTFAFKEYLLSASKNWICYLLKYNIFKMIHIYISWKAYWFLVREFLRIFLLILSEFRPLVVDLSFIVTCVHWKIKPCFAALILIILQCSSKKSFFYKTFWHCALPFSKRMQWVWLNKQSPSKEDVTLVTCQIYFLDLLLFPNAFTQLSERIRYPMESVLIVDSNVLILVTVYQRTILLKTFYWYVYRRINLSKCL